VGISLRKIRGVERKFQSLFQQNRDNVHTKTEDFGIVETELNIESEGIKVEAEGEKDDIPWESVPVD
jgi:hypothetical protein